LTEFLRNLAMLLGLN